MERIVRILNQSGLQTRQYMDRKTGDQKVINSVVLKLTDGIDTFLGEITGERAVNCPKYDPQYIYKVQCSMVVREWNSQQTGEYDFRVFRSYGRLKEKKVREEFQVEYQGI